MSEDPPVPAQTVLRAAENMEVWGRSLPALEELNRRGIPTVVLKSLPQIEELYGDAAGRRSGDVDLLVPTSRMLEALTAIRNLGWDFLESSNRWDFLSRLHGPDRAASLRPWHLVRGTSRGASIIDLHGDSLPRWIAPTLDAQVWQRARSESQDGITFLTLGPEDRLLLLCWHFFAHSIGNGLDWDKLRDVELALSHGDDLDWRYVGHRAAATGTTVFTHLACELCFSTTSHPLVPRWRDPVPLAAPVRQSLLHRLFSSHADRMNARSRSIFVLLGHDRLIETMPAWREIVLPSRVYIAADYLGHWPTWPEYVSALSRIYAHRIANTAIGE